MDATVTEGPSVSGTPSGVAAPEAAVRTTRRRRRVLAGLALILACLTILITTIAVWAHQVAFNTDRFTALVENVIDEPAVIDPLSAKVSAQVVTSLNVQGRIEQRLPDQLKPLAASITLTVQDAIANRLQQALNNPRVQQALVRTISVAHERIMNLLRDQGDAVQVVNGYVVVDVWPIVDAALAELQSMGIIPADIQLPDLSEADIGAKLGPKLESALGITLPSDFGTIQLMPADRLLAARTVVRAFDLVVILLILLSVALVALALWLSANRRMMLIYLALGVLIVFLLFRLATNAITGAVVGGIADQGLAGAVRTVADTTVANLRQVTLVILIATGIVAIAAYVWGRPRWLTSAASMAGSAAGQAGSAAASAGSAGIGAVAAKRPSRDTLETTVRDNRPAVERYGLAIIIFIVAWIALGLEIAVIGAVLVIAFELLLRAVAPTYEEATDVATGIAASPQMAADAPVPTPVVEPLVPPAAAPAAEASATAAAPSAEPETPSVVPNAASPTKPTRARSTKKPPPST